jgi:putative DNA methylase
MTYKKKLIEVALPLDDINVAAAREKSIRHGHPSTLHLWWARRPLAACRAVLFAQLVDDPSAHPERFPSEEEQNRERERLFAIIRRLVQWENINNEEVLEEARREIRQSAGPAGPPPLLDPFAGGGSIPLEGQRLGLEVYASDLNPVAVLINKALIELPPRFAGQPPVNPAARGEGQGAPRLLQSAGAWPGARGLAEDVRYYGGWMRDEAERRIGHLYPRVKLPPEQGGGEATVIAWLWARTVTCPNPACGAQMPLVSSFWLSKKNGKQAWVEPVIDRSQQPPAVRFTVQSGRGKPSDPPKIGRGAKFKCLACGQVAEDHHIKKEGSAKRMGAQLMAIVVEGKKSRLYLPPSSEHEAIAQSATPQWAPTEELPYEPRAIWCTLYGLTTHKDLFTPRQLVALTTFSDLVGAARAQVQGDAQAAGISAERASAYADAVATYLAFAVDKTAEGSTNLCTWSPLPSKLHVVGTFGRQALPMVWDFAEANVFADSAGNLGRMVELTAKVIVAHGATSTANILVRQMDAGTTAYSVCTSFVSTDPPYYDNIGYADLSDFFYVWLRRALHDIYPELFGTILVPKAQELVANPYRFNDDYDTARRSFEQGLRRAFEQLYLTVHSKYPLTIYYAFKQTESDQGGEEDGNGVGTASTGWETMLEGLIRARFQITGTWPMRTERAGGFRNKNQNALASSIVLVCRPKTEEAPFATRRDFLTALRRELPAALKQLQQGNIAPVDLAQASIGPGMALFSRYSRVLEADGSAMRVRTALALINQALDEYLAEQEGEYDADTRWALAWFEQHGFEEGLFGDAETLSKAKNTSVQGLVEAGILYARGGKVRLLRRTELPADWRPTGDKRLTVWEVTQHLIRALQQQGEPVAGALLAQVDALGEIARDLAYRLYQLCERKGWAQEALPYNSLVISWPELVRHAQEHSRTAPVQGHFEIEDER